MTSSESIQSRDLFSKFWCTQLRSKKIDVSNVRRFGVLLARCSRCFVIYAWVHYTPTFVHACPTYTYVYTCIYIYIPPWTTHSPADPDHSLAEDPPPTPWITHTEYGLLAHPSQGGTVLGRDPRNHWYEPKLLAC